LKPSTTLTKFLAASALALGAGAAFAFPEKPECIAPAKPGGGFDLTCRLAQSGLHDLKLVDQPIRITYMPGGIGAVAFNTIVAQRPKDANAFVAFSGGSLLNLAQGKFGRFGEADVRWVGTVGTDYGMIAVRDDSPYKTLKDLLAAIKAEPAKVVFGAGGTIGSQDWMKAALVARAAGVDYKSFRYVAFEGGGEAFTALMGGHVQVIGGDASEALSQLDGGAKFRVLAVFSDKRLPGKLANAPTAKEQGYDLVWPTIRGFYVAPKISDAEYKQWVGLFDRMLANPGYTRLREDRGLFEFSKTGADLEAYVKQEIARYRKLSEEFGLVKK
jgi:putative tricarboxylic transport membrane protein